MADYGNPRIYGAMPVGSGIVRMGGYNPYATIPDIIRNADVIGRGFIGGQFGGIKQPSAAELGFSTGIFNPIPAALMTGGLTHTLRFLPQARLIAPPQSKTYSDAGRLAELWSYLGFPYRHPASYNVPGDLPQ